MPMENEYPGVYIQEIPPGVRTITGVPTSVAAFVGCTARGPTNKAGLVTSWLDYERTYGGWNGDSELSCAVYHFFRSGGQQAYVVRLAADGDVTASATFGDLVFTATAPGTWSHPYQVQVKQRQGSIGNVEFDVNIRQRLQDGSSATAESFQALSMSPDDARFVESVLNGTSSIVSAHVLNASATAPPDGMQNLAGGADGQPLNATDPSFAVALGLPGDRNLGVGLLREVDIFNLLCVPGFTDATTLALLQEFCLRHRAFLIIDPDPARSFDDLIAQGPEGTLTGDPSRNSAVYFPRVRAADPSDAGLFREFNPSGFVAGIYARTDSTRGVWKAPAGIDASVTGATGPAVKLDDAQNGKLNVRAVNCIRDIDPYGVVVWGARTLQGTDEGGSQWKYIPVRRTALFIEESLFRGLKWVVFEPNDEALWAQIRLNVGAFMHGLFRQGAFQGATSREAFFVKCGQETTTQDDIDIGVVNIVVGFALLKPDEFVVIKLQQNAGQIPT